MALTCVNPSRFGPALTCDERVLFTAAKGFALLVPGTTFTSATDLVTEATWNTKIAAESAYIIQKVIDTEVQDADNTFEETSYGDKTLLIEGKRSARYKIKLPLDQHQIAYENLNGQRWELIIFDLSGNIIATKNTDGTIRGFTLGYSHFNRLPTASADAGVNTMFDYDISSGDLSELDVNGIYINPTLADTDAWSPFNLDGVLKVYTSSGSISTHVFTTAVSYINTARPLASGAARTEVISGLTITSFEVINQTGAVITPDSVTETPASSGSYVVTCTTATLTSGSVQVIPVTTAKYKSPVETL